MKRPLKISSLLLCAVALQSCTRELDIQVSTQTGTAILSFTRTHLMFWTKPYTACVNLVSVHEQTSDRKVWTIRASNDKCVPMHQISVGDLPNGFEIQGTGHALASGRSYYAVVIAETEAGQSGNWVQP